MNNILDIRQGILAVIIGTLFKEMKKKPCILTDITGTLGMRKPKSLCSEGDSAVLEDSSGRIRLRDKTTSGDLM